MQELQDKTDELINNLNDTLRILSEMRIYELTGQFDLAQMNSAKTRTAMTNALAENIRNCLVAARRIKSLT